MTLHCPLRLIVSRNRRLTTIKYHPYPSTTTSLASILSLGENRYVTSCSSCSRYNYNGSIFHKLSMSNCRLLPVPNILTRACSNDASSSSSSSSSNGPLLPPLTPNYGPLVWPKFTNTLKNFFFHRFVIVPYMDPEFNLMEFVKGAREAVVLLSKKLARGDFEDLEELVHPSTLEQVKRVISTLSVTQRELLAIELDDILLSFTYEIGIIMPDSIPDAVKEEKVPQQRFVEITTVFHVLRNRGQEDLEKSFQEFVDSEDTKRRTMVINYRFHKNFTENQESSWIVKDIMNYFPAQDLMKSSEVRK